VIEVAAGRASKFFIGFKPRRMVGAAAALVAEHLEAI
jgi:hypothetical protein